MKYLMLESILQEYEMALEEANPIAREYGYGTAVEVFRDRQWPPVRRALYSDPRWQELAQRLGWRMADYFWNSTNPRIRMVHDQWFEGVIDGFDYAVKCMDIFAEARQEAFAA